MGLNIMRVKVIINTFFDSANSQEREINKIIEELEQQSFIVTDVTFNEPFFIIKYKKP